jgi:hypothetical protein
MTHSNFQIQMEWLDSLYEETWFYRSCSQVSLKDLAPSGEAQPTQTPILPYMDGMATLEKKRRRKQFVKGPTLLSGIQSSQYPWMLTSLSLSIQPPLPAES